MATTKSVPPAGSSPQMQKINLAQLPLQQLSHLQQQVSEEVEILTESVKKLKIAQTKFEETKNCMNILTPGNEGKEVLVPLTTSMYTSGTLSNTDTVIVDIGTGYFVEKTIPDAKIYFSSKIDYLQKQIDKVLPILQEKQHLKDAVTEIFQIRIQSQIQQQYDSSQAATTSTTHSDSGGSSHQ